MLVSGNLGAIDDEVFELARNTPEVRDINVSTRTILKRQREGSDEGMEELRKSVERLNKTIKKLTKFVETNTNTKAEIKN